MKCVFLSQRIRLPKRDTIVEYIERTVKKHEI